MSPLMSPLSLSLPTSTAGTPGVKAKDDPKKVLEAAQQFESLIVSQVLKSAGTVEQFGSVDGESEQSSSTMLDMAQEFMAQVIAQQGGFGIAKMVAKSLNETKPAAVPPTPPSRD